MAECIAYVIDYSENEDFRKKCFQLLRHELEQKILSNAKCDISFVLSSIEHEELDVSNELNYPGMFDRFLFCDTEFLLKWGASSLWSSPYYREDATHFRLQRFSNRKGLMESPPILGNGPDNETYFQHLKTLEKNIETASYCESDLTQGVILAMDGVRRNPKKFAERTIFVLSDMKKSNFSSIAIDQIKEKSSTLKINIHSVSESQTSTPFGDSVPIEKILQHSGFSRKIVQRRNTKTPFYLFNSAEDSQLEMKLQTLGKSERSKLG